MTLIESGSQLVIQFVYTFKQLSEDASVLEFITMLSGQISSQVHGTNMRSQTPQIDVFPHIDTIVCNTKK
jgi:peroxiredoxin